MKRLEALRSVDKTFGDRPIVVTCGAPARELAAIARRDSHLYLLDSMGLATAVGAGLALAGCSPLAAVEGDGSLLMGFQTLPTIAAVKPPHLTVVVLDNHEHASADRVPTHAVSIPLAEACRGVGLDTHLAGDEETLTIALEVARAAPGPTVVVVEIEGGNEPGIPLLLEDPAVISERFRSFLENRCRGRRRLQEFVSQSEGLTL